MVTVSFELHDTPYVFPNVTIPLFGPQYIRYPMQPGDKGLSFLPTPILAASAGRAAASLT
jgi:hypothetical protein